MIWNAPSPGRFFVKGVSIDWVRRLFILKKSKISGPKSAFFLDFAARGYYIIATRRESASN